MSVAASFLGLPRPAGGSGCAGLAGLLGPAALCGGFAACWTYLVLLFLLKQTGLYYFGAEEKQWAQRSLLSGLAM